MVGRIAAAEIFQANIARRWTGRLRPGRAPFALFERLGRDSPAPFAGYLRLEGRAVVSNSPERFIQVDPRTGPLALTQPIKGTRPRGDAPRAPQRHAGRRAACGRAGRAPHDRALTPRGPRTRAP